MHLAQRFRVTAAPVLLAPILALAACNTVEGLGQDVEETGEAVDEGVETITE